VTAAAVPPATGALEALDRPPAFSWRRVMAVVRRQGLVQYRNPGRWFLLLALPVVDAVLFSSIGVAYGEGKASVRVLFTGILLFHLVWQLTLAGSIGFLEEVWSRNLLNLLTTPLREIEYAAALFVVGLLRTLVAVTLIGAVGLGLYSIDPSAAGWVLAPSSVVLLVFGWAVALFVVGLTLQFGDSAEVFSWGTLVLLMPLSGVFYPVEALPGALQALSKAIPLTRAFDATREGIEQGGVAVGDLLIAGAGSVVAVALGFWFVLRQLRRFREQGWVTRHT
jgi:ABC-2 type transport system permease protein